MSVSPPPAHRRLSTRGGVSPEIAQISQLNSVSPSIESVVPSGAYPSLPAELQSSISQFRIAGFAQKYFSTHKKGLFRRKVPMERMLLHQKSPLSQPLMVLNKRGVQKDALRCFKIIQKLMGERKGNGYVGPTGVELGETCVDLSIQSEDDIKLVLELIKKGLDHGELRDEIYVQLCKQLTENPSREGSIKGWHLFTILLITFSPSKNLHDYLASFLNQHATTSLHPIPVMAQHCHDLLRRISKRGSRAKLLTLVEIARAQEAAFRPSVFEATLERLMGRQMAAGGEWAAWRVPRLMVFLKESVIELGGLKTEGIFRISGDLGAVAELRARIELGNYDITGITDPHVPCSLLRLWIRDLPEPVIPYDMYQQCIQGAQDKDAVAKVITSLPLWHKEMIIYLISFLKEFNNATVREATKMSLSNLAMVFAPTLLQCSSDDAPMLMGHLQAERAFVSTLISEVELADEDLRIVGEATGTK
ncbi:Rho GTPase activation protein [Linnemannia elongata]|nr:Rho GTPase activation protein [Linnemannia elongata]